MIGGNPNYWNLYATKGHNHDDMYSKLSHNHLNTLVTKYPHHSDWVALTNKTYAGGWHGNVGSNCYLSIGCAGGNYSCDLVVDGNFYSNGNIIYPKDSDPIFRYVNCSKILLNNTLNEGTIAFNGSQVYAYFHNPNYSDRNSHTVGYYHSGVGVAWEYNASSRQLLLKAGYGTSSDIRLKNNIKQLDDRYDNFFMSLKPVAFKYNDEYYNGKTHIGLIAQDVADNIVENDLMNENLSLVKCSNNEYMEDGREYNVAYQELIALNIKMIQKHENEVKELTNRIETLEQTVNQLLDKVNSDL